MPAKKSSEPVKKITPAKKVASPSPKEAPAKSTSATVKPGSKVKFHYTGKLEDGELFDSSGGREPLEFEAGKGMIIPGLEKEMMGMKKGGKKTVTVNPKEAYGDIIPELIRELPKGPLPPGMKLEAGAMLYLKSPDGQPIPVRVVDVKETTVVLDLNHPLAGKKLTFEVEIVEIN